MPTEERILIIKKLNSQKEEEKRQATSFTK